MPAFSRPSPLERLASWSALLAGLLLICLVVLIQECVRNQVIAHDLRIMEHQREQWEDMANHQQAILADLKAGSKPLLERLALTQLHMQVVGTRPLNPPQPDPAGHVHSFEQLKAYQTESLSHDSLENILTPPFHPAVNEVATYAPPPSALITLTTQVPYRDLLLVLGIALIALGLWPGKASPPAATA